MKANSTFIVPAPRRQNILLIIKLIYNSPKLQNVKKYMGLACNIAKYYIICFMYIIYYINTQPFGGKNKSIPHVSSVATVHLQVTGQNCHFQNLLNR